MATTQLFRSPSRLAATTRFASCTVRKPNPYTHVLVRRRSFQQDARQSTTSALATTDFGFAFDIDGVLLRSSKPIERARQSLVFLQKHNIPFILLTNGGGKSEADRVEELSRVLDVPLSVDQFMQSHTPFGLIDTHKESTVMVMGGTMDGHRCRLVAERYGFKSVVTPADVYAAHPEIWPFGHAVNPAHTRRLPLPLATEISSALSPSKYLQISSIFVYNDPRDWGLDLTILLDLLLSHQGYLGTLSPLNGNASRPNQGYQQDGQPDLCFSNLDLWWAAHWHNPRLGQGGFEAAVNGVWAQATNGARLQSHKYGKPEGRTFASAESMLLTQSTQQFGGKGTASMPLKNVYMVGDNPASDIQGANNHRSSSGINWESILVRSGVFAGGEPQYKPTDTVDDVWDAVQWGLERSKWRSPQET